MLSMILHANESTNKVFAKGLPLMLLGALYLSQVILVAVDGVIVP